MWKRISIGILVAIILLALYSFLIEPNRLVVRESGFGSLVGRRIL